MKTPFWMSNVLMRSSVSGILCLMSTNLWAANASVQQQQVNLRQYQAQYDAGAQKYIASGVTSTPTPSAQFASAQSEFRLKFGGTCQPNTHLKQSELRYYGDNSWKGHNWIGQNNFNEKTKSIPTSVTHNARLAEACNAELQRKINGGATYNQLKSAPFQVWQAEWGEVTHKLTCSDGAKRDRRAKLKADVICGAADVTALKRKEKKNAKILEATATLTGAEMGMQTENCPVQANLRFYVKTDFPTVVEYQVVTPTGQASSKRTLSVSLNQGSYYEASTNIPFSIPQATRGGNSGLPPGTVRPAASSMTIGSTGPGAGTNNGQAGSTTLSHLQPANTHSNAFRIKILKPKRFQSNSVGFSVKCLPRATHSGPGSITAKPRITHPGGPSNQLQNPSARGVKIQPLPKTREIE